MTTRRKRGEALTLVMEALNGRGRAMTRELAEATGLRLTQVCQRLADLRSAGLAQQVRRGLWEIVQPDLQAALDVEDLADDGPTPQGLAALRAGHNGESVDERALANLARMVRALCNHYGRRRPKRVIVSLELAAQHVENALAAVREAEARAAKPSATSNVSCGAPASGR